MNDTFPPEPSHETLFPSGNNGPNFPSNETEKIGGSSINFFFLLDVLVRKLFWLILFTGLIGGLVFYLSGKRPKKYKATALIEVVADAPKVFTDIRDVVEHRTQQRRFYATQETILKSRSIAQKALIANPKIMEEPGFYNLSYIKDPQILEQEMKKERSKAVEILQNKTTVNPIRNSSLFEITIVETNRQRAKELALAIAEAYQEYNRQFHLRVTLKAFSEIKQRLSEYTEKYADLQKKMVRFRETNDIISTTLEDKKSLTFKELEEYVKRLTLVVQTRIALETELKPFKKIKVVDPMGEKFQRLLINKLLSNLKEQYSYLLVKRAALLSKYKEKHREVKRMDQQLATFLQILTQQVQIFYESYQQKLRAVRKEEQRLNNKIRNIRKKLRHLEKLNSNFSALQDQEKAMKESLNSLNKRYFELQLLKDSTTTNVRIIEKPKLPEKPFSPRIVRDSALSVVVAFLVFFGIFLLIELLDRTVHSLEDIRFRAGVIPIGDVPLITKKVKNERELLYNPDKPNSPIEEAIRTIRTNIQFRIASQSKNKKQQVLLFTSPSPSEGKTFVISNMAIGFGHTGNKTILVDCDMRKPRVHKIFDLQFDRSKGVSAVIAGQCTLDEAVISMPYPNLDILPCGPIPPDPTELLQTESFHNLLEELKKRYDTILFDTPPTLNVTDSAVLSSSVDGVLIISTCAQTTWGSIKATADKIQSVGGTILGCVLNKFNPKKRRGYYSYGGYGYGGYGYGGYYSYKNYEYKQEESES